ncbi:DUF1801 domain-containing protein [Mycetocola manganoxydans]|uniref:DUF1801 domain-containing protein n=1 Tax=Mycetocola manganoxydans TaxID=699879 RepID=A0A3L6ZWL5_9MICO|nr:DUF1801 domain-containing protein [Mycetocola manganoxydans]RLP72150.1 DUF1801 domain-containing protein [Mycetocola manganoxydans]GHD52284.1 hypothetical protein GCM10008097_27990 [Mycetocola manganoxydans]
MAEQKTVQTASDPDEFLASIENEKRRTDAVLLRAIMAEVTGEDAAMWGPSMVGFGSFHYRYASGHEGDTMKVGFAPRKTAMTLYGLQGHPSSDELLTRLGPHTLGKGCVYIKKLGSVDENVLRELIAHAYANAEGSLDKAP